MVVTSRGRASRAMPTRKVAEAPAPPSNTAISRPCLSCRKSKVRCDRAFPCSRCLRLNIECVEQQRTRRGKSSSGASKKAAAAAAAAAAATGAKNVVGSGASGKASNRDGSSTTDSCGSSTSCPISSDEGAYEDMSPQHFYNLDDDDDDDDDEGLMKAMEEDDDEDTSQASSQPSSGLPSTNHRLVTSFMRQHHDGKVSRQKTLAIMRGWAMGCSSCSSDTSSDQCLAAFANALGLDWRAVLSDSEVIGEAEGFTKAVHRQVRSFDAKDLDPFLKDIYSMACASVAFICCGGERRLVSNQGYSAEFIVSKEQDEKKVNPLDICGCVSPEDYEEFAESVTTLMFCCPQTHGETAHVIKCHNRHGEAYMALARVRFLIADGGDYMAAVLSLQRLPPSRYVFTGIPSVSASLDANDSTGRSIKHEGGSKSYTKGEGATPMLMFPTSTLDCTTSSASSSTSSLSLLMSSAQRGGGGPPPLCRWTPSNSEDGAMMVKTDSSANLPFNNWLQEGDDPWSWSPVGSTLEAQKTLVGEQQIGMDFTTESCEGEEGDALRIEDAVQSPTGAGRDNSIMQLLEEDIF